MSFVSLHSSSQGPLKLVPFECSSSSPSLTFPDLVRRSSTFQNTATPADFDVRRSPSRTRLQPYLRSRSFPLSFSAPQVNLPLSTLSHILDSIEYSQLRMTDQLNRSNTTTTFSSFFCTPNRKPSLRQLRPTPPPNYQHIDDVNNLSSSNDDPPSSLMKLSYPRSNSNRAIDLRASKLGMVEKMSSRERIERWNDVSISSQETEELTPLERWRMEVAREVAREKRKEEVEAQQRQKEEEEEERKARESMDVKGTRVTSWKPSVLTTSSMRSAAVELQNQFESSSRKLPSSSLMP